MNQGAEEKEIVLDPLTFDKRCVKLLSNVGGKRAQSTDLLQGTLDMLGLNAELENWERLTGAVNLVLQRT